MDVCYYYEFLAVAFVYEKGRQRGLYWRIGEKRRLRAVVKQWCNTIDYIRDKRNGINHEIEFFAEIEMLSQRFKLPNYKLFVQRKSEIMNSSVISSRDPAKEDNICSFLRMAFQDIISHLRKRGGKTYVYRLLNVIHNLPKTMCVSERLFSRGHIPLYNEALASAQNLMDNQMKNKYKEHLSLTSIS